MVKLIVATANEAKTRRWHQVMQEAMPEHEVLVWEPNKPMTGARYGIVWSPPNEFFETEIGLQAVFNLGAGVDGILKLPSLPDIPVYRLEDAGMATQMAEYVIHSIATYSRQFDTYLRQQEALQWNPLPAVRRQEWSVGVMGLGQLGAHVAQAVAALGYPVAGWARRPRQIDGIEVFHGTDHLKAFLARSRVLVNLLPLTPDTEGIINADLLAGLMPNAVVINIARGRHVVDADLLAALDNGHVQAAVLDVFHQEPLPAEHPYWRHPKVRVTPHVAAATIEAEAADQIRDGVTRLEQGEQAKGLVRRDTGY